MKIKLFENLEQASGPNKEYLYNLAKAMKELVPNVTDSHLEDLDQKVRELEAEDIS